MKLRLVVVRRVSMAAHVQSMGLGTSALVQLVTREPTAKLLPAHRTLVSTVAPVRTKMIVMFVHV